MDPGHACDVVWDTLEEVYGREEVLIENALKLVRRPERSIGQIRQTLLEFRADLKTLRKILLSLNKESNLLKPQFLGSLYMSLNDKLKSKLEGQCPPRHWTYEEFLFFIDHEIEYVNSMTKMEITSFAGHSPVVQQRQKPATRTNPYQSHKIATLENRTSHRKETAEAPSQKCCLHPESMTHQLCSCRKFKELNVLQRWDVAKEFGLCFNCLSIDHKSRDCNSKSGCDRCNSRHHFLLHKEIASTNKLNYLKGSK